MSQRWIVAVVLLIVSAAIAADDLPFSLPVLDDWRTETIPFPLGFAPDLAYEGLEELRFAPGMFKSDAEDFWSYAFVWWIDADEVPAPEVLAGDLVVYYDGLADGAGPGATAQLQAMPSPLSTGESIEYRGKASTIDTFVTDEPVHLNVRVSWRRCQEQNRLAIVFELSPQDHSHPIWRDLRAISDGFRCGE